MGSMDEFQMVESSTEIICKTIANMCTGALNLASISFLILYVINSVFKHFGGIEGI